jgi:hypothetical protein
LLQVQWRQEIVVVQIVFMQECLRSGRNTMRKFDGELADEVSNDIIVDELDFPADIEALKELAKESVEGYDFPLFEMGDYLSAMPLILPSGLVNAAIETAWDTVDWKEVMDSVWTEVHSLDD